MRKAEFTTVNEHFLNLPFKQDRTKAAFQERNYGNVLFPDLQSVFCREAMSQLLYADFNATTPLAPGVLEKMRPFLREEFGNPSSLSSALGRRAREAIEEARSHVAALLGAAPEEVVFVSGGSEASFHALVGAYIARQKGTEVLTSVVEHPAVFETLHFLEESLGARVTKLPVDATCRLDLGPLKTALEKEISVVSFMLANNETGGCLPLDEVVSLLQGKGITVHTDAVQAVGKMPIHFSNSGIDLLSVSAHKLGGPKGIGALVIGKSSAWKAVFKAGGQEGGKRGGTEAVSLIAGFGVAARVRAGELRGGLEDRLAALRDEFEKLLLRQIDGVQINAESCHRLCNTSSVRIANVAGHELAARLAEKGIIVSTGSACKTSVIEPSHVLKGMGLGTMHCLETLRVSFGVESGKGDAAALVREIKAEVERYRAQALERVGQGKAFTDYLRKEKESE